MEGVPLMVVLPEPPEPPDPPEPPLPPEPPELPVPPEPPDPEEPEPLEPTADDPCEAEEDPLQPATAASSRAQSTRVLVLRHTLTALQDMRFLHSTAGPRAQISGPEPSG